MSFEPDDNWWTGIPPNWAPEPAVIIEDRDLEAFMIYAKRERALDASLRAMTSFGEVSDGAYKSILKTRAQNTKRLFRETRRGVR